MAFLLYRLGGWSVRRRGWVVAVWLLLLALMGGGAALFGGTMTNSFTIPDTPAQSAIDQLGEKIPGAGGSTGRIVFKAPDGHSLAEPQYQTVVQTVVKQAALLDGVVAVTDPLTGQVILGGGTPAPQNPTATPQLAPPNGQIGFATLQMQGQITDIPEATQQSLADLVSAQSGSGVQIELGGAAVKQAPAIGSTEGIGVVVALIVLLITFGSLVAAGLPMLTALIGIGIGVSSVLILSRWIDMSSTSPILALMLGLAVGIDYALFIVSRHRKQVVAGMPVGESIARATGTAGSAVVFAGLTVFIALAALTVVGIPFLTVMGLAAAFTVMLAVLIAITMLPALLSFAGLRVVPKKLRATVGAGEPERDDNRWIRFISRYPALVLVVGVLGVGAIAIPAASLHLALPDDGTKASDSTSRLAYDLLAEGFGAGVNGPLIITVSDTDRASTGAAMQAVTGALTGSENVVAVAPLAVSADGTLGALSVIPGTGPSDRATETLVHRIRDQAGALQAATGAEIKVTGQAAVAIDVSEKLAAALPIYLIVVVGLALILLMLVFRSIVVPVKAAVGFLLSIAASFGAVVAVFQWGWFGVVDTPSPIISFLPILLIGVLFGLAMDYEVFLVAGMRESYAHGQEAKKAVVTGFAHGSKVVTAAGIIMISVFAGFVLAPDAIIASIGFALAFGVLVDAFVVRMTLVPAVMTLLGRAAWYLPKWLDKVLPNVDIEGERLVRELGPGAGHVADHGRHERDDPARVTVDADDDGGGGRHRAPERSTPVG